MKYPMNLELRTVAREKCIYPPRVTGHAKPFHSGFATHPGLLYIVSVLVIQPPPEIMSSYIEISTKSTCYSGDAAVCIKMAISPRPILFWVTNPHLSHVTLISIICIVIIYSISVDELELYLFYFILWVECTPWPLSEAATLSGGGPLRWVFFTQLFPSVSTCEFPRAFHVRS